MRYKTGGIDTLKIVVFILLGFYFLHTSLEPQKWTFLDNVNLIFHEAGHVLFIFFGQFLSMLGGSLMQILIPTLIFGYFYFRKQYFSAHVVLFWVGHNFINVSVYVGDAIVQQLPLLGGGAVIHDWNYLLSSMGILEYTTIVAGIFFWTGVLIYFIAIFRGFYDVLKRKIYL